MIKSRGIFGAGVITAVLALAGCGEIAYKTGASADSLEADRRVCKQADTDQDSFRSCMNRRGWSVADLDAPAAPKSADKNPPHPANLGIGENPPEAAAAARTDATRTEMIPPAANPSTPVPVSGWVKFGGGSPDDAIAGCVAALGPAHKPDQTARTVTAALLACMRDKGWRGL